MHCSAHGVHLLDEESGSEATVLPHEAPSRLVVHLDTLPPAAIIMKHLAMYALLYTTHLAALL